ncbi:hypothetical protein INR49_007875 [Caranx melampygus]|nr:hypothetical protein INR49_007875 [Caranx melampygus]
MDNNMDFTDIIKFFNDSTGAGSQSPVFDGQQVTEEEGRIGEGEEERRRRPKAPLLLSSLTQTIFQTSTSPEQVQMDPVSSQPR